MEAEAARRRLLRRRQLQRLGCGGGGRGVTYSLVFFLRWAYSEYHLSQYSVMRYAVEGRRIGRATVKILYFTSIFARDELGTGS